MTLSLSFSPSVFPLKPKEATSCLRHLHFSPVLCPDVFEESQGAPALCHPKPCGHLHMLIPSGPASQASPETLVCVKTPRLPSESYMRRALGFFQPTRLGISVS